VFEGSLSFKILDDQKIFWDLKTNLLC
jgi:hypothetical protein